MSQGKYSPITSDLNSGAFVYNCYGQIPESSDVGQQWDEKTMLVWYDAAGYDRYGYSAFNKEGEYVGIGSGIDRSGNTEYEYAAISENLPNRKTDQ